MWGYVLAGCLLALIFIAGRQKEARDRAKRANERPIEGVYADLDDYSTW